MKMMLLTVSCFLSLSSFANVCEQSWETINQNFFLSTDFPKVQFGTVFVSVDGVCVSGDHLYTQAPVTVCTQPSQGESSECLAEESLVLATPVTYTKDIPVGEGRFETITQTHPMSYNIAVGRDSEGGLQVQCHKNYTIPACL